MKSKIDILKKLRENGDHVEFKAARHEYPFTGGKRTEPKEHRRCVFGYVVALANEKGGKLVLGMADHTPHEVVGSDFAEGEVGNLEDEINAGGFPIGVDLENILTTNSVPRNKLLCEVLQKTGLIERSSQGVDKMFYQSDIDGKALPSYANTDAFQVSITFFAAITSTPFLKYIKKQLPKLKGKKALSVQEIIALQSICLGNKNSVSDSLQDTLRKKGLLKENGFLDNETPLETTQKNAFPHSSKQLEILDYLSSHPSASRKELSEHISNISEDGIKYNLKVLQQKKTSSNI